MPLPLGHIAIGAVVYDLSRKNEPATNRLVLAILIVFLANLPDMDIVIGLLFRGDEGAFHRGPTHSLLFALSMGFVVANAWRLWSQIPRIDLLTCFLLIFSHVAADFFFTSSPVSFFWPLEINWVAEFNELGDVTIPVFLQHYREAVILTACGVIILLNRMITQSHCPGFQRILHKRSGRLERVV
jgi:membrane-bound metal-dependent hydrolase YbcI (DUF457 family)